MNFEGQAGQQVLFRDRLISIKKGENMKLAIILMSLLSVSSTFACHNLVGNYEGCMISEDEDFELLTSMSNGKIVMTSLDASGESISLTEGENLIEHDFMVKLICHSKGATLEYYTIHNRAELVMKDELFLNAKRDLVSKSELMGHTETIVCKRK